MWKRSLIIILHRSINSSSSNEIFTNDLLRKRLLPSVLLPLYCNEITNRIITDSRVVMITPAVVLLNSPKFIDFRLLLIKYHIWGVTAFESIILATLVFQQLPEYPFFRHEQQLKKNLMKSVVCNDLYQ